MPRKFDVVMVWAVDRLGRSLPGLIASMQDVHGAKVDLFIHQQGLDTTTASGRAMFGMLYQRAYALTVAQWRWVIVLIRSGSSIRNRHAFAHAATIAS